MKQNRRKHSSSFKAKVAMEAIQERNTLSELCKKYELSQAQISKWKKIFVDGASIVFDQSGKASDKPEIDAEKMYAKIGRLELENDFLKKNLNKIGA
jgi:transposase-like protein